MIKLCKNILRSIILRIKNIIFIIFQLTSSPDAHQIFFESFQGRRFSCNPRALYEELQKNPAYAEFTSIWAVRDPSAWKWLARQPRTRLVKFESISYYKELARSRYWIFNSRTRSFIQPGQRHVFLQTWHGTPYKKIGCDIEVGGNALEDIAEIHAYYKDEGQRLTYMLSPSPFCTEKLVSAFHLHNHRNKILELGYPRNVSLFNRTEEDIRAIKKDLHIPLDKKIILYAPTFRDNQHESGTGYVLDIGLDFHAMQTELGNDYILLFRAHYFVASRFDFSAYRGFVYNVSDLDDINALYLVSDLLITDYSSVFFDYANLRRPILFYMYDYEEYQNKMRDFYLNTEELPGPVVYDQPELITAIRQTASYKPGQYSDFYARFNPYDNCEVSRLVLQHLIQNS